MKRWEGNGEQREETGGRGNGQREEEGRERRKPNDRSELRAPLSINLALVSW
jgi:hypothetical protein